MTGPRLVALCASVTAAALSASAATGGTPPRAAGDPVAAAGIPDAPAACVYTRHSIRGLEGFERLVRREIECAVLFNDVAERWADWESPWFLRHGDHDYRWDGWVGADPGRRWVVISQSMAPTSVRGDWRARGARGAFDRHVRALGENLVRHGLGRSVIRLGHEANFDATPDHAGDTRAQRRAWARYWARAARVLRRVPGAEFRFDWTVNAGYRPIPFAQYYPGDRAVDIVGIDQYDSEPHGERRRAERWRTIFRQDGGLGELLGFARRHHKPVSIPEWGLVQARDEDGAGDNPYYVRKMARVIAGHRVVYHGIWHAKSGGITFDLRDAPRSLTAYRRSFAVR